jgi:transcriptional regulator with XRE-family HTH domain
LAEKINDIELDKLLRQGYTTNQLANHFGCSPAAVSQRKRKLQKGIVAVTTLEKADQVVTAHMDMMGQLRRVNGIINDQLDLAVQMLDDLEADRLAIQQNIVKLASEVRRQQESQVRIFEAGIRAEAQRAFQQELMDLLEEVSPKVRDEFIRRLRERKLLRGSCQPN